MNGSAEGEIVLTVLFDNYEAHSGMAAGWGFAALLETPEHTILFDTGADGDILLANMRLMEKDPMAIEAVVISHAHGDHTVGLQALHDLGVRPRVYLLSAFPSSLRNEIGAYTEVIRTTPGMEIVPGIRSTGQVGTAIPEQALILETTGGMVVLTGCAHPGAVEMATQASRLAPGPIDAVLGGFHLEGVPDERVRAIVEAFQGLEVRRAGPTHCSGARAMEIFREAYGDRFVPLGVGRVVRFPV
jgi:7,8-dihydropterin-6-yl-methyl-4-(beta-D-ribofuranosyl)aminobenzene 5'-phosphate synthase